MKKEELLNSDFLKQFKSGEELTNFLGELQKRGIEQFLTCIYLIIKTQNSTLNTV